MPVASTFHQSLLYWSWKSAAANLLQLAKLPGHDWSWVWEIWICWYSDCLAESNLTTWPPLPLTRHPHSSLPCPRLSQRKSSKLIAPSPACTLSFTEKVRLTVYTVNCSTFLFPFSLWCDKIRWRSKYIRINTLQYNSDATWLVSTPEETKSS